jgi:hypothetical protein
MTLLRDTEFSITEIAFATGWGSLGTFGRIFRDITGHSPGALRREARAGMPELDRVPACVLKAVQRPDLKTKHGGCPMSAAVFMRRSHRVQQEVKLS